VVGWGPHGPPAYVFFCVPNFGLLHRPGPKGLPQEGPCYCCLPRPVTHHQPIFLLFPPPVAFLLVFSAFALTLSTVSLASPLVLMPK
jgi:hypothetical protein